MQEVKIEEIIFANGISGCPGTYIDENLMEQFKNALDIEEFKVLLSCALKDTSNKLNTFEWGVELSFLDLRDSLSNNPFIEFFIKIYLLNRYEYRSCILFYNSAERHSEFKIDYKDLNEKGVVSGVFDFFEFIKCMNAYLSVRMYRSFNEFDNCCPSLIKNKMLFFDFIDYIDKEFDYKYKENLAECYYINYLVGKDIRFSNEQKINNEIYDYKEILKCLVIAKCIPNKISLHEITSIFEEDNMQAIIDNLKLLLY